MRFTPAALLALTLAMAGCSTHGLPGSATSALKSRAGVKDVGIQDIINNVVLHTTPQLPLVAAGMPATMRAPSDVSTQRALENLYSQVEGKVMPELPTQLDEELYQAEIPQAIAGLGEITDPTVVGYLQGVADRLSKAAKTTPFKVYVANTPVVNAFNAGGHALVVFSGLLLESKDEAELAAVFAHEMTHGLKRHALKGVVESISSGTAESSFAKLRPAPAGELDLAQSFISTLTEAQQYDQDFVLSYLQGKVGADTMADIAFTMNDNLAQIELTRNHEAEADQGGVRIVAGAGYDPQAMVQVFERWNTHADGDTRYYSHPALGSRAGALKGQIAREGLHGDDRGADRLAAAQAALKNLVGASGLGNADAEAVLPAVAGNGCFAGSNPKPLKLVR